MSLHAAAKHLSAQGRGNDKMLVHMTPSEVRGLMAIAKAQGHELTINPETGLPEAGILEQVLPMIAAGAAIYFTGGLAAGALAPALGTTAAGILGGAGAGALIGGGMSAIQGGDVGKGALMGGIGGAITGGMGGFDASTAAAPTTGSEINAAASANANIPVQASNTMTQAPTIEAVTGAQVDPYAGLAGTTPPAPPTAPSYTPNQLDAIARGQGVFPEGSSALPGQAPNEASLYAQEAATKSAAAANVPTPNAGTGLTTNQKLLLGGLGVMGLGALEKRPGAPSVAEEPSVLKRISPNFRAQQPIQPNPYYRAQYPTYAAKGGLMASGGPVEQMTQNMMGGTGNMYPQSQQEHTNFATPTQMPASAEVVRSDYDAKTDPYRGVMMAGGGDPAKKKKKAEYTSEAKIASLDPHEAGIARLGNAMREAQMPQQIAAGLQPTMQLGQLNLAQGGHLGGYSDGGRLLKGPGDGVSDSIPATIGKKQPARLADGEFVVPARIVSELGNGSTDAGARKLYGMMDRIQKKRRSTKGIATDSKVDKFLPA